MYDLEYGIVLAFAIVNFLISLSVIIYYTSNKNLRNIIFSIVSLLIAGQALYTLNEIFLVSALLGRDGSQLTALACIFHGFFMLLSLNFIFFWTACLCYLLQKALHPNKPKDFENFKLNNLLIISTTLAFTTSVIPIATSTYGENGELRMCNIREDNTPATIVETVLFLALPFIIVLFLAIKALLAFRVVFYQEGLNSHLRFLWYCLIALPVSIVAGATLFFTRQLYLVLCGSGISPEYEVVEFCSDHITSTIIAILYGILMKRSLNESFYLDLQDRQASLLNVDATKFINFSNNWLKNIDQSDYSENQDSILRHSSPLLRKQNTSHKLEEEIFQSMKRNMSLQPTSYKRMETDRNSIDFLCINEEINQEQLESYKISRTDPSQALNATNLPNNENGFQEIKNEETNANNEEQSQSQQKGIFDKTLPLEQEDLNIASTYSEQEENVDTFQESEIAYNSINGDGASIEANAGGQSFEPINYLINQLDNENQKL